MESKFHRWWLGSCVAALLLASWVGGFSLAVTAVFTVIYLTGVTLIGPEEAPSDPVDVVAADPDWDSEIVEIAADSDGVAEFPGEAEDEDEAEVEVEVEDDAAITVDEVPVEPATVAEAGPAADAVEESAAPSADEAASAAPSADGDDDAVPYPDDFESTAVVVEERSPAP
jgi:hypothetical protein